jgi:hypothetical protein
MIKCNSQTPQLFTAQAFALAKHPTNTVERLQCHGLLYLNSAGTLSLLSAVAKRMTDLLLGILGLPFLNILLPSSLTFSMF